MSKKKPKTPPPQLTPEEQKQAEEAAAAKAKQALERDQTWVDGATTDMTADQKDEILRYASRTCKGDTMRDGKIVMACPMPDTLKMQYCAGADHYDCPNGRVSTYGGCLLSPSVSKALTDAGTCIDGTFVSKEEGGSYLSPYVPWGPIAGRDKTADPVLTTGNSSGVTIGTGVDLGSWTEADLTALQKAGVSKDTIDKLRPWIGKKRDQACKELRAARANGPIVFPQSDIETIDAYALGSRVAPLKQSFNQAAKARVKKYQTLIQKEKNKPDQAKIRKLQAEMQNESKKKSPDENKVRSLQAQIDGENKQVPDDAKIKAWQDSIDNVKMFNDLKCSDQTILMSTYYHEGRITASHTQPYVNALIEGDSKAAESALVAKTKDKNPLIASRGAQELQLFQSNSTSQSPSGAKQ